MAQVDDRVLVEAAQAGDPDAFEMLVRRYQASVYRIALRLLGSSADSDDVTQDTFVRAWLAFPRAVPRREHVPNLAVSHRDPPLL